MYDYRTYLPKTWEEGSKLFKAYKDNGFPKHSYMVERLKRRIKIFLTNSNQSRGANSSSSFSRILQFLLWNKFRKEIIFMKLVPIKKDELKNVYKKTKNLKIFDEFLESDHNTVRVVDDSKRSAKRLSNSLHQSLRWYHLEDKILVVKRGESVYMIKKNI